MKKVLFVCMGNICRSSMAEGLLRDKIRQRHLPLVVDSAGTHRYHQGEKYDRRAREVLATKGIDVEDLRSRPIACQDFSEFDTIFAADEHNIAVLQQQFGVLADKVMLMTAFSHRYANQPIPDPYYGGDDGFSLVYDMLDESIEAWLAVEDDG